VTAQRWRGRTRRAGAKRQACLANLRPARESPELRDLLLLCTARATPGPPIAVRSGPPWHPPPFLSDDTLILDLRKAASFAIISPAASTMGGLTRQNMRGGENECEEDLSSRRSG